jgi:hypothetical protein
VTIKCKYYYHLFRMTVYCNNVTSLWLVSGLDDWIYWRLLLQSLIITINYNNSQSVFSRTLCLDCRVLAPFSFSFYDSPQLNYADPYILSARTTHRKHISSIVACVSVGIPTWSLPSQSIGPGCWIATVSARTTLKTPLLYFWLRICLGMFT